MSHRVLIVDDEAHSRERLVRMLVATGLGFKIDQATNGYEALEKVAAFAPEILFLDIQMPELSGFDVLQNIEKRDFQIIFQTAFDHYAVQAFEESACDYLLKPIAEDRLQRALAKAQLGLSLSGQLQKLESDLKDHGHSLEKIVIKQGNKVINIHVKDIVYFSSQDHYTRVFTEGNDYVCDLSLNHLEERLPPDMFIRCHRAHIVALAKIAALELGPRMQARLSTGAMLEVSRQNRSRVKERFQN